VGNFVEVENVPVKAGKSSEWIRLQHTTQSVTVVSDNWQALTAKVQYSVDGRDVVRGVLPNDSEMTCTRNRAEIFAVPGFVRLTVAGQPDRVASLMIYADPENAAVASHTLEEVLLLDVGTTDWIPLTNLKDIVCVSCPNWVGSVVKLELSFDGRFVFPLGQNGEELYCKQNIAREIEVGGLVRLNAERLSSPVRLTVASFNASAQKSAEQLTTNSLMIDLLQRKPEAKDFTVRQWAEAIIRSVGSIHGTKTWKALQSLKQQARIDRQVVQRGN